MATQAERDFMVEQAKTRAREKNAIGIKTTPEQELFTFATQSGYTPAMIDEYMGWTPGTSQQWATANNQTGYTAPTVQTPAPNQTQAPTQGVTAQPQTGNAYHDYVVSVLNNKDMSTTDKANTLKADADRLGMTPEQYAAVTGYTAQQARDAFALAKPAALNVKDIDTKAEWDQWMKENGLSGDAAISTYFKKAADAGMSRADVLANAAKVDPSNNENAVVKWLSDHGMTASPYYKGVTNGNSASTITPTSTTANTTTTNSAGTKTRPTTGNAAIDGIIYKFTDRLKNQLASGDDAGARNTYNTLQSTFGFTDAEFLPFAQTYAPGLTQDQVSGWKAVQSTVTPQVQQQAPAINMNQTVAPMIDQSQYMRQPNSGYGNIGGITVPPPAQQPVYGNANTSGRQTAINALLGRPIG